MICIEPGCIEHFFGDWFVSHQMGNPSIPSISLCCRKRPTLPDIVACVATNRMQFQEIRNLFRRPMFVIHSPKWFEVDHQSGIEVHCWVVDRCQHNGHRAPGDSPPDSSPNCWSWNQSMQCNLDFEHLLLWWRFLLRPQCPMVHPSTLPSSGVRSEIRFCL